MKRWTIEETARNAHAAAWTDYGPTLEDFIAENRHLMPLRPPVTVMRGKSRHFICDWRYVPLDDCSRP